MSLLGLHNGRPCFFVSERSVGASFIRQSGTVLAIVAPGQGAQTPGFLASWLESASFAERLASFSEAAELDLAHYGTEADADTIRDTAIAQPLLVASAIAVARELNVSPGLVAGHSVGELAAAALAGVLSDEDAVRLVAVRGRAMAEASAVRPTSMTAVIAGKEPEVLDAIEAAGLTAANNNGSGQIVAAGTVEQLQQLAENPPRRARLVPLSVAGAFHTIHMEPAVDTLRAAAAGIAPQDPDIELLSNRDGAIVTSGDDALERMIAQVANPVRWDLCMDAMRDRVTGMLELTPAGTLTGIAKRNLKDVALFNLNTPDQLDEARAFAEEHASERN